MAADDRRARILVVDDHPTNIDILVDLLRHSYEFATASGGAEAIEVARTFRPDLVLLDNMMPGMDGYATCRVMRELPETRRAKILMVSAKARVPERVEGYEAGADDYIAKPFDHDELLAKIRVYVRLKSAEEIASLRSNLITLLQHETRTPMAVLGGALEALRSNLPREGLAAQAMGMALSAASQLQQLHDRIVLLSRLRSGGITLNPVATNVSLLALQCCSARQSAASGAEVVLKYVGPEYAWVLCDAEHMSSVVGELIDNALRYTASGGEVRVEIDQPRNVVIRVIDDGAGIPAEALSTIMDEFVVGDIDHHRRGTGLGLAIARELVTAFGGTIAIDSLERRGTTVTLEFPAIAAPAEIAGALDERDDKAQAA
jgi:two-component system, sensor histidine kinase and response regulator